MSKLPLEVPQRHELGEGRRHVRQEMQRASARHIESKGSFRTYDTDLKEALEGGAGLGGVEKDTVELVVGAPNSLNCVQSMLRQVAHQQRKVFSVGPHQLPIGNRIKTE